MKGGRWIFDRNTQELVPADEFYARKYQGVQVSELPGPMLISDCQPETKSMVTGKYHDSKSAMRREYKERGYIEVGNEEMKVKAPPKPDRRAIRDSVRKAAARVGIST
jgi:hypothetical protein